MILTARYFDKRRGLANALCLSGTAAGSFTLPFLIEYLLESYGFRGTMLVLSGCMLHILVSAALYRPLSIHVRIAQRNRQHRQLLQSKLCIDGTDDSRRLLLEKGQRAIAEESYSHQQLPW